MSVLAKVNKLKSWQAMLVIVIVGFLIFFTGLTNQFQGDDSTQIVSNVPVHSIGNIKLFFEGGTFYNGQGLSPLSGAYFRPLMTAVFSLIYTLFGAHPFYFHLLQILLCIGSAMFLYLFFRYSFKPTLALLLALIFLAHPLNSQVAFAIPSTQDALYFFFGILAMWLLLRFKSLKSLVLVALCLLLSLLSKETGILFVALALLYLFIFDSRKRLYSFMGTMVLPVLLYLVLRINAIGLFFRPTIAPIDNLSLGARLMNAPSIVLFYMSKFIFPWRLAVAYYWTHPSFSLRYFLLPLLIELAVVAIIIYLAVLIRKRLSKTKYYTFLFFTAWVAMGLILTLQIFPLDMTVCETWFYFSMAGVLGMIGVVLGLFRVRPRWFLIITVILITVLGVRTAIRGLDYRNAYILAFKDVVASPGDYNSDKDIAIYYYYQGNYNQTRVYAERSVAVFPNALGYNILGQALSALHDYPGAANAYMTGMKHEDLNALYENMAALTAGYGTPTSNTQFLLRAVANYPKDPNIWFYLAIQEDKDNSLTDAKIAIGQAYKYGGSQNNIEIIYYRMMNNLPLDINFNSNPSSQ